MHKAYRSKSDAIDLIIFFGATLIGVVALATPILFLTISPPCLITYFFHVDCWGCGITRAIVAALQGHFYLAWQFNHAVIIVLPIIAIEFFKLSQRIFCRRFVVRL